MESVLTVSRGLEPRVSLRPPGESCGGGVGQASCRARCGLTSNPQERPPVPRGVITSPHTEEETRAQVKALQSHSSSVAGPESKPQSLIPESVLFTRLW